MDLERFKILMAMDANYMPPEYDGDIFHYTSPVGFQSILFGDTNDVVIWASRYDCLNDMSEGKVAEEVLHEVAKDLFTQKVISKEIYDFYCSVKPAHTIPLYREVEGDLKFTRPECNRYVCSFSKNSDSLAMWNYYSKGSKYEGFNIGFYSKGVKDTLSNTLRGVEAMSHIYPVIYDINEQKELIRPTLLRLKEYYSKENLPQLRAIISTRLLEWACDIMDANEREAFWKKLCSLDGLEPQKDANELQSVIHYPRFLFRYRAVTLSSVDALQTNHLFFSKANYYDDPFDTLLKIDYQALHKYLGNILSSEQMLDAFEQFCSSLNVPTEEYEQSKKVLENAQFDTVKRIVDTFFESNIQSSIKEGVWSICFAESGTNENMWLKYADQYRGFCLVYDMPDSEKRLCGKTEKCKQCVVANVGVSLYPIYYSDEGYDATEYARCLAIENIVSKKLPREKVTEIIAALPNMTWQQERISLIKSKCHEYDQEWRMILHGPAEGPVMQEWVPYGVILGIRTSNHDRKLIIRSAKLAGIEHIYETYITEQNRLSLREIQVG